MAAGPRKPKKTGTMKGNHWKTSWLWGALLAFGSLGAAACGDDDEVPDLTFDLPDLAAGTVANVFAVNDGGDIYLLAQLGDATTVPIDSTPQS